jgi:phosphoglycerate dehydrogenase-like enzyme
VSRARFSRRYIVVALPKVVLSDAVGEAVIGQLDREFKGVMEVRVPRTADVEELKALVKDADVLVVRRTPVSGDLIRAGSQLKLIQKIGRLPRGIDLDAARERGIPVAAMPIEGWIAVAEHALTLMLAVSRQVVKAHESVVSGSYRELGLVPQYTTETSLSYNWAKLTGIQCLWGKTLGLVGLGEIGTHVALRARAFEMEVIYYDVMRLPENQEQELGVTYVSFDDLFRKADYVSLHVPHNPSTEHLISARPIALMKPTAFLINTCRGNVVQQADLYEALKNKRIAGAGLDVFREEPVAADDPILQLDNVVLTPHIAAMPASGILGQMRSIADNVKRAMAGQPLRYPVK